MPYTPSHFLECYTKNFVTTYGIALVVIVYALAVLDTCPHQIGHIYHRDSLADIMCDSRMPEGVCMQREITTNYFADLFEPKIEPTDKMLNIAIVGDLRLQLLLVSDREYIPIP